MVELVVWQEENIIIEEGGLRIGYERVQNVQRQSQNHPQPRLGYHSTAQRSAVLNRGLYDGNLMRYAAIRSFAEC